MAVPVRGSLRWTTAPAMKLMVVGLGHQATEDHLPAVLSSDLLVLAAVVDEIPERAERIGSTLGVPYSTTIDGVFQKVSELPDAAIVAVPHSEYVPVIANLATRGISIIKEKPFAVSLDEARVVAKIIADTNVTLRVTLQRRFNPIYMGFAQLIRHIGRIHAIEARYTMNVRRLDEGWRASQLYAGGGALVDLGYHYVDLIVWYFGLPDYVSCRTTSGNRPEQAYDTEDTAFLQFGYMAGDDDPDVLGSLIVSRVYPSREESLVAYGTAGSASVSRGRCQRFDLEGNVVESLERDGAWPSALVDQLEQFATVIQSGSERGRIPRGYLEHVAFVDAGYRSALSGQPTRPHDALRPS